jgi:linoleoyl-CoA desaturase
MSATAPLSVQNEPRPVTPRKVATYQPSTAFARQLHGEVEAYFATTGKSKRDAPAMYLKTVVMLSWLAGSYLFLLLAASSRWQAVAGAVSLGLAMAGVGFNIQHDGNHGAYSRHAWVNRMMSLTLDLLGGTAYFWHFKHNIAHHTHPNIAGQDDDISLGVLGRVSPHQRWRPFHRFQWIYMWLLYAVFALQWQLGGEFRNLASKRWCGTTHVPFPRGQEQVIFWVGKLVFLTLAFGLPALLHPFGNVVVTYLVAVVTLGLVLATVFQVAHVSDAAEFRAPEAGGSAVARPWAEHQVETTVNFARGNRVLNWYLGGLNHQIEHHLFPKVCHVHYAALSPIVEAVCLQHGVRYFAHPSMRAALSAHARWLYVMGKRPDQVAARRADAGDCPTARSAELLG